MKYTAATRMPMAKPVEVSLRRAVIARKAIQKAHNIPDELCFSDYNDLLNLGKIADIAVIATMKINLIEFRGSFLILLWDLLF